MHSLDETFCGLNFSLILGVFFSLILGENNFSRISNGKGTRKSELPNLIVL
jgi:hypothetical protein